jgi:hypothetical protein
VAAFAAAGVSERPTVTVERYVKGQIKKPCAGLAARLEHEVRKRWQPQIRAKVRQKAATTGGIVIDTRARLGCTAPIGSTDQDRIRHLTVALPAGGGPLHRHRAPGDRPVAAAPRTAPEPKCD